MLTEYTKLAELAEIALGACAELEAYEKEIYEKLTDEEEKEYADTRKNLLCDFLDGAVGEYGWIREYVEDATP